PRTPTLRGLLWKLRGLLWKVTSLGWVPSFCFSLLWRGWKVTGLGWSVQWVWRAHWRAAEVGRALGCTGGECTHVASLPWLYRMYADVSLGHGRGTGLDGAESLLCPNFL